MRLGLVALCLLVVLGAAACGGSDEPDVEARALVLTRPDVPDGFVVNTTQTAPVTNADVARTRPPDYVDRLEEWGRIEGFSTQFRRDDIVRGPLAAAQTIDSVASVYEDADGAAASFASGIREYPNQGLAPAGRATVGDEGRVFRGAITLERRRVEYVVLTWRRGPVIAAVVTSGRPRRIAIPALTTLAEKQDRRILRALA